MEDSLKLQSITIKINKIMKDLVDYQHQRIVTLQSRVAKLERYVLELCDNDCPKEYKKVVLNELIKNK